MTGSSDSFNLLTTIRIKLSSPGHPPVFVFQFLSLASFSTPPHFSASILLSNADVYKHFSSQMSLQNASHLHMVHLHTCSYNQWRTWRRLAHQLFAQKEKAVFVQKSKKYKQKYFPSRSSSVVLSVWAKVAPQCACTGSTILFFWQYLISHTCHNVTS